MSGINELKEKSKKQLEVNEKRKMNLDEIFDNQAVGKPANQKTGNPEVKQNTKQDNQQTNKITNQTNTQPHIHLSTETPFQQNDSPTTQAAGHTNTQPETQINVKPANQEGG